MRRDHQVVTVHDKIAHGGYRQIELQRLPVRRVIERNAHTHFRGRVEQPAARRVFANRV